VPAKPTQARLLNKNLSKRKASKMEQAYINLAIMLSPLALMLVAMIIKGEF
jgi:hypothetical protein